MGKGKSLFAALVCGWCLAGQGLTAAGADRGAGHDDHGPAGPDDPAGRRDPAAVRARSIDRSRSSGRAGPSSATCRSSARRWAGAVRFPGRWPRPPWLGPRPFVVGAPVPGLRVRAGGRADHELLVRRGWRRDGLRRRDGRRWNRWPMGGGGMGGRPPGGPAPAPPDQVALMCQRLQSFYSGNRKEAAYTLGRLGDPRAVPSLVHVLKYDNFKDVRVAAAIALGEIGGSDAAVALERSSIYDHREDVRKACDDGAGPAQHQGPGPGGPDAAARRVDVARLGPAERGAAPGRPAARLGTAGPAAELDALAVPSGSGGRSARAGIGDG